MKVMLIVPPGGYFAERWSKGNMMPALGISYIAAVLEREGVDVELIPAHVLGMSFEDIGKHIAKNRPDILGITTTTENRFLSFDLARISKEAYEPAFVLLGGPHMHSTAYDTLNHITEVDGVIMGEGEETVLELVSAIKNKGNLNKIKGLAYRENGSIIINPSRAVIEDINALPMPARHLEPWDAYNFKIDIPGRGPLSAGNMMTSRGCPFECTFCATPVNWGRHVRGLTPENVIKEIIHLVDHYDVKVIWFYDDTFNYNKRRLEKICDLIIEQGIAIKWYAEIRVDLMDKRLLEKMVMAGCYYVGFGIESGSERVCKEIIKKKSSFQQAYDVINWCSEFGIIANPFFIFSHPTETWEEAMQTMEIIEKVKGHCDISTSILHIYPGTQLEQRARKEGQLPIDFSWAKTITKEIIVLPAAQGHVPLYVDKLSWPQICELMFRFSFSSKKISLLNKIPGVLRNIYSFNDVKRYTVMFLVFLRLTLLRLLLSLISFCRRQEDKRRQLLAIDKKE